MSELENKNLPESKAILDFIKSNKNQATLSAILSNFKIELSQKHHVRRKLKKLVKDKSIFKIGKIYQINDLEFNSTKSLPKNLKVKVLLNKQGKPYCQITTKKASKVFKDAEIVLENYSKDYLNKDLVVRIVKVEGSKIIVNAPTLKKLVQNQSPLEEYKLNKKAIEDITVDDINNKNVITGRVTSLEGENKALVKSITFGVRKSFTVYSVPEYVKEGDIVKFTNPLSEDSILHENSQADFIQLVHKENDLLSLSLLSLKELHIPIEFPEDVLKETTLIKEHDATQNREDLTNIPLVTIDGDDSKDFDDAVYCKPYEDKNHKNCFHIIVAIADVAHYVKKNSALDKEALLRANSVYLPNMVVPMLPPLLSNNLCSLVPNKERKAIALHIYINGKGDILKYNFTNALIRSHARLTYKKVQSFIEEGNREGIDENIQELIANLHECFKVLHKSSILRGALKIDLPETKILMDENENITQIQRVYSKTSNKIIEEFMVLANVCAALFIQENGFTDNAVFRIHAKPDFAKIIQLKETLKHFKYKLDTKNKINGSFFNKIIDDFKHNENKDLVYKSILQTQSQAKYSNENIGHFGLALKDYAHFTSPIRRYSDLIVHRIIKDILAKKDFAKNKDIVDIAKDISAKERRAASAEYNSIDRIIAKHFEKEVKENKIYTAKITSVTKSGIFVLLDNYFVKGLVPMRFLNHDDFIFDGRRGVLKGSHTKQRYELGDKIEVKIAEVDVLRGLIAFYPAVDFVPFSRHANKGHSFRGKSKEGRGKQFKKTSKSGKFHKKRK